LLVYLSISPRDIYSNLFEKESLKCDINSDFSIDDESYSGIFTYGPSCNLPEGKYKIELSYNADSDENYIEVYSDGLKFDGMEEKIFLEKNASVKTIYVESEKSIPNLEIKTYYSGEGAFNVNNIKIESEGRIFNDSIFMAVVSAILLAFIGMHIFVLKNKITKEFDYKIFFILLAVAIFVSYPVFVDYIRKGNDIIFHIQRIEGIKDGLLDGQFPVRIHPRTNFEYGHAISSGYPELFLYIPAILRLIGLSIPLSYGIFIFMVNLASAGIAYFSFKNLFNKKYIGLIGSVIYLTASYRLLDLYTRSAVGEGLAMIFIPLVIYGVYEIFFGDSSKWRYFTIACTGILQSHILSSAFSAVFLVLFGIVFIKRLREKERFVSLLKSIIFILLINIWFIVPFLYFREWGLNTDILKWSLADAFMPTETIFRIFPDEDAKRNIYKILALGAHILLGTLLFVYEFLFYKNEGENKNSKKALALFVFGVMAMFMASKYFPWKMIEETSIGESLKILQFPWRLVSFGTALLSGCAAYAVYGFAKRIKSREIVSLVIIIFSLVIAGGYINLYNSYEKVYEKFDISRFDFIGYGEYLPEGSSKKYFKEAYKNGQPVETSSDDIFISDYSKKGTSIELIYNYNGNDNNMYIEVPLVGYPGYSAILDNKTELMTILGSNKLLRVYIGPNKSGKINIEYTGFALWDICFIISILAAIYIIISSDKIKVRLKKLF